MLLPGKQALQLLEEALTPCIPFTFPPRAVLFDEGEAATHFFWLRSGVVKLVRTGPNGSPHLFTVIGRPRPVGLADLFRGTFSARAEALTPVEACRIERARVLELMQQHAFIFQALTRKLDLEFRRLEERARRLQFCPPPCRLAHTLRDLAQELGLQPDGSLLLPITREELASLADLSQRTLSEALRTLEHEGLLQKLGPRRLRLHPDRLAVWLQQQRALFFPPLTGTRSESMQ
ncbi:Crp/Fnr family transcriptional regulator [Rhodothermus marinus]|uniref:Crp/Fnr family transcriptional regulator n=1 Tax=Rhodothermus marinus TaxID=29549 RepID=UPI0037C993C4